MNDEPTHRNPDSADQVATSAGAQPTESPSDPPAPRRTGRSRILFGIGTATAIVALGIVRLTTEPGETSSTTDASRTPRSSELANDTTSPTSLPSVALADPSTDVKPELLDELTFTDVTEAAGLGAPHSNIALLREKSMTSGAAVADVDGDGFDDVYLTRVGLPNLLYRNNGDGTFTDIAASAGVLGPDPGQGSGAAAFADIDGDGCLDLYVAAAQAGRDALYVNNCNLTFDDELADRGIDLTPSTVDLGAQQHGVTFDDIDLDGDLDLLVAHWDPAMIGGDAAMRAGQAGKLGIDKCADMAAIRAEGADRTPLAGPNRSRMYLNDGTGRFADATARLGLPLDQIAAFTPQFVDIDGDRWPDLLVTGDFCTSRVYKNNGGTSFTDITEQAGVATDENAMGSVVRDVNGDGHPDWFITSIRCGRPFGNTGCSGNRMFINDGSGRFADRTDEYGVRHGWWGWGAAIEDFAGTGALQVAQANGYVGEEVDDGYPFTTDPFRLWIPGESPEDPLVEAAEPAGLGSTAVGHAVVPFDYDNDGDLDLLVANFGDAPQLFRNDRPADRAWLTVRLDDPTSPGNRSGIGAKVVIDQSGRAGRAPADAGPSARRQRFTGWIITSGSYESHKPAEFHVGLGEDHDPVASIEVWWPGDTEPQRLTNVAVDQVLTVRRG